MLETVAGSQEVPEQSKRESRPDVSGLCRVVYSRGGFWLTVTTLKSSASSGPLDLFTNRHGQQLLETKK